MSTTHRETVSTQFITGRVKIVIPKTTNGGNEFYTIAADTDEQGAVLFDMWKNDGAPVPEADATFTALIEHERVTSLSNGRVFDNHRAKLVQFD